MYPSAAWTRIRRHPTPAGDSRNRRDSGPRADRSRLEPRRPMRRGGPAAIVLAAWAAVMLSASCLTAPPPDEAETRPPKPASLPESPAWMWNLAPEDGTLVFVGVGGRRGNRDEESYAALEDAALQAGVYAGFWGASQDLVVSDAGGTGQEGRTRARYNGPASDAALQAMDAEEIWRTDEATWVRFTLESRDFRAPEWRPRFRDGEPEWIRRTPDIPGYQVSVGLGGERSTLARSLRGADVSALADMIDRFHGANRTVNTTEKRGGATWSQGGGTSATYDRGFGEVEGFLVIARWVDAQGNAWSLAVSPVSE